ncbi:MAG: SpaH/EbpB family LPXTG-anchored major pilin [Oscillospiraceae bacterium]|nr:SpaH/EbpB family LPXTG-anchored major pilin [Oscillospiraceae bacterium]
MKNFKKLAGILLALVMVLTMTTSAFAATIDQVVTDTTDKASITVTVPVSENTDTYKIYKVFDAEANGTNISYKLVSGKTDAPKGFVTDAAGNVFYGTKDNEGNITPNNASELSTADIEAIKAYVTNDMLVATVTTEKNDSSFTVDNLPYGYYYITTTTGTLVTVDSTTPNASVEDKNTVPILDKEITGATAGDFDEDGKNAIAQIGSTVTFTVTINVGAGATNYVFHDELTSGLVYNNDITINDGANLVEGTDKDYTIVLDNDQTDEDRDTDADDITVTFTEKYLSSKTKNAQITITYTATITEEALNTDPEKNTAWLTYGNDPGDGSNTTPPSEVKVYNAKFTVTKTDGNEQPLAGAGFVLMNADGDYYKLTGNVVSWEADIANATEYVTEVVEDVAAVEFVGLANGTYTLVEKTVPAGYNKAADVNITIDSKNYTNSNLMKSQKVVNNSGSELPSTGGIGTTIFYISGAVLAIAAVVFLVTKKRMSGAEEE